MRGSSTAPRCRESALTRGRRGARRLLVLAGLLAVLGVGRLLRHAGDGLGVLLAGLRGVLLRLVRLVLPVLAHGDLSLGIPSVLPRGHSSHAPGAGDGRATPPARRVAFAGGAGRRVQPVGNGGHATTRPRLMDPWGCRWSPTP